MGLKFWYTSLFWNQIIMNDFHAVICFLLFISLWFSLGVIKWKCAGFWGFAEEEQRWQHQGFLEDAGSLMAAVKTSSASASNPKPKTRILKPSPVSPQLSQFFGTSEASRTEALKKIWDYVKLHNLQNPANRREIQCNEKLKTIFDGKDKVGFPEVAKLLSHHFMKSG